MKLKVRPADFEVTERLREGVLVERGHHRVYLVTKRKRTTLEAAAELARLAGVAPADVGLAGLKDRQGVTKQYMSVPGGRPVQRRGGDVAVRQVGWSDEPIASGDALGNRFSVVVRDLDERAVRRVFASRDSVRTFGLPNYFGEQRFGNVRHGQGWILVDLVRGDVEGALKRLVASASPHDDDRRRRLKDALWRRWGDWRACRDVAGKLGRHHSVFEHLRRRPDDFEGAFRAIAGRERLIHLYAFQSHLWNRALVLWLERMAGASFTARGIEGKLVFPYDETALPEAWGGALPLPGARLEGVDDLDQRALFEAVLARHRIGPDEFVPPDLPGFVLKPEPRPAVVVPEGLRIRPAEPDELHRGRRKLRVEFALPRGSYATLVVRRLVGPTSGRGGRRPADGGRRRR